MISVTIAAAQIASHSGDLDHNLEVHAHAIQVAARHGVSVLIFPELSLTGYEPSQAPELALYPSDDRLMPLRLLARRCAMTVVLGGPLVHGFERPHLAALAWEPDGTSRMYAKMHLGENEQAHFTPGDAPRLLRVGTETLGLAICADASVPSHPQQYADAGASVYAAGVFLNAEWYETDAPRFPRYATQHGMLVLMANHADSNGTYVSVGKSAAWGPDGALLAQADGVAPCLVLASKDASTWRGEVVPL